MSAYTRPCSTVEKLFPSYGGLRFTSAKDIMLSSLSVCLSVCLLTVLLKSIDQIFMKFYEIVGHNPETSQLDFEWS